MQIRFLALSATAVASLACAPAIAQSPPPPAPPVTMQPVANPPEAPKPMMHAKKWRHVKKMAKAEASPTAK